MFGAVIPIANVTTDINDLTIRIISSILGDLIAISTGFLQLSKAHERWLLFSSTAENLKREYHLFMHGGIGYSSPDQTPEEKNKQFVETAEAIMARECSRYVSLHQDLKADAGADTTSTS